MSDSEFIESLIEEHISWRISELALIKKIFIKLDTKNEKKFFLQTTIPIIYAIWEGFVKNSFKSLLIFLNDKNISVSNINKGLLVLSLDDKIKSLIDSKDFNKKIKHSQKLVEHLQSEINFNKIKIDTKSNLNKIVLLELYTKIGLDKNILNQEDLDILEKLIRDRNIISHGDKNGIVIQNIDEVEKYISLIQTLMNSIIISIDNFLKKKDYLL